jgi:hypothetical protein
MKEKFRWRWRLMAPNTVQVELPSHNLTMYFPEGTRIKKRKGWVRAEVSNDDRAVFDIGDIVSETPLKVNETIECTFEPIALGEIVHEHGVSYCVLAGRRLAKRVPGQPWASLEPGWRVSDLEPGLEPGDLSIEYDPTLATVQ